MLGSGGVGGYFGGRLAQAGHEVIFLARGRHLEVLKTRGLQVNSCDGDFAISPVKATSNPEEIGPVDLVMVAVKSWQLGELLPSLQPLLGKDTMIVPLLNGVSAPGQLAAAVGSHRVLGGLCKIVAFIQEPGTICHGGFSPYLALGELDGERSARVDSLYQTLSRVAGMTVEVPSDISAAMWNKFLFVASLGGVGALARAPAGILRTTPQTRELIKNAMGEIEALAARKGIDVGPGAVENAMAILDRLPEDGMASMQRDIMAGRPSELDGQTGAIYHMAVESGCPCPIHATIYRSLVPLERKARGLLNFP